MPKGIDIKTVRTRRDLQTQSNCGMVFFLLDFRLVFGVKINVILKNFLRFEIFI